ncbi:MAG: patatin-like phospholipase family protein [Flavobacteriales bacterium]|nr:patatin-like phospholipase family protein [Flavobacteriales bacterium]
MIKNIFYFLPTQLLLTNLKRNHIIILFWILLFGIVNQNLFVKYGIPNLFLAPEYLNEISFWSFAILGFSFGGFVMAFNITGYVINSGKFPFIAAIKHPFLRYCINNSLIPLVFILFYLFKMSSFLMENEIASTTEIVKFSLSFVAGYSFFIFISFTYFFSTNRFLKNLINTLDDEQKPKKKSKTKAVSSFLLREKNWFTILKNTKKWHVEYYLYNPFTIRPARDISHYDINMLKSIFKKNSINATIFELVVFISFIGLGFLNEIPIFIIPAAASLVLLFTTILILFSAIHTWLKSWATLTFILLFVIINYLSKKQDFNYDNRAYGLNYNTTRAVYTNSTIDSYRIDALHVENDIKHHLSILESWKIKNSNTQKPKIIFINTSGGGSRAALWTFYSLQYIDSLSNGELFKHTHLITGSSGGMIGASYYRELYLKNQEGYDLELHDVKYRNNIAKDLLNPIAFYIATNDFFIRTKQFEYNHQMYTKDRGFAFEKQLLDNTNQILDKPLIAYKTPEQNSEIPLMIFSPAISNDARRLLISPQSISFLTNNLPNNIVFNQPLTENIEFRAMYKNQGADSIRFSSVIRMSSTFPYIMPSVSLPSEPKMIVLDAGLRDNYGTLSTFKYIHTFQKWIEENTSGIIILTFRDKPKETKIESNPLQSLMESISLPIGSLYGNLFAIQDYNFDDMMQYLSTGFKQPIHVIDFELDNVKDKISLSWHLTKTEKENVFNSMKSKNNQMSLIRFSDLMNTKQE